MKYGIHHCSHRDAPKNDIILSHPLFWGGQVVVSIAHEHSGILWLKQTWMDTDMLSHQTQSAPYLFLTASEIVKTNHVIISVFFSKYRSCAWLVKYANYHDFLPNLSTTTTSTMCVCVFVYKNHLSSHHWLISGVSLSPQEIVPFGSITTTGPTTNLTGQKVCVVQKNPQGHVLTRPGWIMMDPGSQKRWNGHHGVVFVNGEQCLGIPVYLQNYALSCCFFHGSFSLYVLLVMLLIVLAILLIASISPRQKIFAATMQKPSCWMNPRFF